MRLIACLHRPSVGTVASMWRAAFSAEGPLSPLRLAGLAAWLAAWFSLDEAPAEIGTGVARVLAIVFLMLFLSQDWLARRCSALGWLVCCLSGAGLALAVIGLAPRTAAPVLLVQAAPLWARRLGGFWLALALVLTSAALALVMWRTWPRGPYFWIQWLAFSSLQVFAALVFSYSVRSSRMAGDLRMLNSELLATRSLLAEGARDTERLRISRELHDVAGHKLTALKLHLAIARDGGRNSPAALHTAASLADELLADLRAVVRQMRRSDGLDMRSSLEALGAAFPRPALALQIADSVCVEKLECAEVLIRAVQEALTNAARHSHASVLHVRLRRENQQHLLEMHDDGRMQGELREGAGLKGMRERFEHAGGTLVVLLDAAGTVRITGTLPVTS